MKEIRKFSVAAKTKVNALAGAIVKSIKEDYVVELSAIGAGAVNQAVKSIAIARDILLKERTTITGTPEFETLKIDGETRSSIKILVEVK